MEEHLRPEESFIAHINFSFLPSDLTRVLVLLKLVGLDILAILNLLLVILAVFLHHVFGNVPVFFLIHYSSSVP
jgi:hypothetical protein